MSEKILLFSITADYRPNNPNKPKYYVIADTKKEAKEKFAEIITWLKIYNVELVEPGIAKDIIAHPEKHIIIRR